MATHGRSALNMMSTPRTRPKRSGWRIANAPHTAVIASVRTADTAARGSTTQHAIATAAVATVETVVCSPTR